MEEQQDAKISLQDEKSIAIMKPASNATQSTGVWTLVPKELLESEFFKKHVVRMQLPTETHKTFQRIKSVVISHRPPYPTRSAVTTNISQPKHGNMEVKYPGRPLQLQPVVRHKGQVYQRKCSTRPTVIYFNELKNDLKVEGHEERKGNEESPLHLSHTVEFKNKQYELHYLYNKYPSVNRNTLNYIYDVSSGNLSETEYWLTQMFAGKQLFVPQQEGNPRIIGSQHLSTGFTVKVPDHNSDVSNAPYSEICSSSSSSMFSSPANELDVTTRCLIVESMKILYDSEAVLG